jgi:hypothetical protein
VSVPVVADDIDDSIKDCIDDSDNENSIDNYSKQLSYLYSTQEPASRQMFCKKCCGHWAHLS